jgi:uncharacterized membrane protein YgdD (TMEM256/DUF423 family)
MSRIFVLFGSINAFLAVALGAFGAHALRDRLAPELLAVWQTGVTYHLTHALGLLLVGVLAHQHAESVYIRWAGWLLLVGIVLFSGSLYLLAFTGVRSFGMITPLGGVTLLGGWAALAAAMLKARY